MCNLIPPTNYVNMHWASLMKTIVATSVEIIFALFLAFVCTYHFRKYSYWMTSSHNIPIVFILLFLSFKFYSLAYARNQTVLWFSFCEWNSTLLYFAWRGLREKSRSFLRELMKDQTCILRSYRKIRNRWKPVRIAGSIQINEKMFKLMTSVDLAEAKT